MLLPKLAITAGDPSGIGPEIILKAFTSQPELLDQAAWTVIGAKEWLASLPPQLTLIDKGADSYAYVKTAINLALRGEVSGIVTGPISKEVWINAGKPFAGHTEMLATLSNTKRYAMAFASPKLNIMLATIHVPLVDVAKRLSGDGLLEKIHLANEFGVSLGYNTPRIGLAGLNPHAGEHGHIGNEEVLIIRPAIETAIKQGIKASGPYPGDTLFNMAVNEKQFDVVLAMYHDQGLAPLKLIAFHEAVNVTVGLPFVRTSPDHGTAFDIAGKGVANPASMIEAMRLAVRMTTPKKV